MAIPRALAVLVAVATFSGLSVTTSSGVAEAMPRSCSSHALNSVQARSACAGGTGSHRVYIQCSTGQGAYGPWVGTALGSWSRASCPGKFTQAGRIVYHEVQVQGD